MEREGSNNGGLGPPQQDNATPARPANIHQLLQPSRSASSSKQVRQSATTAGVTPSTLMRNTGSVNKRNLRESVLYQTPAGSTKQKGKFAIKESPYATPAPVKRPNSAAGGVAGLLTPHASVSTSRPPSLQSLLQPPSAAAQRNHTPSAASRLHTPSAAQHVTDWTPAGQQPVGIQYDSEDQAGTNPQHGTTPLSAAKPDTGPTPIARLFHDLVDKSPCPFPDKYEGHAEASTAGGPDDLTSGESEQPGGIQQDALGKAADAGFSFPVLMHNTFSRQLTSAEHTAGGHVWTSTGHAGLELTSSSDQRHPNQNIHAPGNAATAARLISSSCHKQPNQDMHGCSDAVITAQITSSSSNPGSMTQPTSGSTGITTPRSAQMHATYAAHVAVANDAAATGAEGNNLKCTTRSLQPDPKTPSVVDDVSANAPAGLAPTGPPFHPGMGPSHTPAASKLFPTSPAVPSSDIDGDTVNHANQINHPLQMGLSPQGPSALFGNVSPAAVLGATKMHHSPVSTLSHAVQPAAAGDGAVAGMMQGHRNIQQQLLSLLPAGGEAGQAAGASMRLPVGRKGGAVTGGLSSRLARVLQQEKSRGQQPGDAMHVVVESKQLEAHLMKCRCRVQDGMDPGTMYVFLPVRAAGDAAIGAGTHMKILPPWEVLQLADSAPVVLAQYVQEVTG